MPAEAGKANRPLNQLFSGWFASPGEARSGGGSPFAVYRRLLGPSWKKCIPHFLCGLLSGIAEGVALLSVAPLLRIAFFGTTSAAVARITERFGIDRKDALAIGLASFIVIGLASALLNAASRSLGTRMRTTLELGMRNQITAALMAVSWESFLTMRLGDLVRTVSSDTGHAADGCEKVVGAASDLAVCAALALAAFLAAPDLGGVALGAVTLGGMGYRLLAARHNRVRRAFAGRVREVSKAVGEIIFNMKFLRASGGATSAQRELSRAYSEFRTKHLRVRKSNELLRLAAELFGVCLLGSALAIAALGEPSVLPSRLVFLGLLARIVPRLNRVQTNFGSARESAIWGAAWLELFDHCSTRAPSGGAASPTFGRKLCFERVSYTFADQRHAAVANLSFALEPGSTLVLTGASGCGKSTVVDLLVGLLQPRTGRITLDGCDLKMVGLESWRSRIGIVLQEATIFSGTILENIAWGHRHIDRDRAEACARMASAWDFVSRMPRSLDAEVGERGANLSGGERQRIALARALYKDPWILVLDEVTSALDPEAEAEIVDALRRLKGRVTMLIVTHRPGPLALADKVLRLGVDDVDGACSSGTSMNQRLTCE